MKRGRGFFFIAMFERLWICSEYGDGGWDHIVRAKFPRATEPGVRVETITVDVRQPCASVASVVKGRRDKRRKEGVGVYCTRA